MAAKISPQAPSSTTSSPAHDGAAQPNAGGVPGTSEHEPQVMGAGDEALSTELQRHVDFFRDGNHITVESTRKKLMELGLSLAYAELNAEAGLMARTTSTGFLSTEVVEANVQHGRFRTDAETGVFDKNGRFSQAKFDELWVKYDTGLKGYLSETDINAMVKQISAPNTVGRSSSALAFKLLVTVAGQPIPGSKELMLTRQRLYEHYQGTLFPKLAAERRAAMELVATGANLHDTPGAVAGALASATAANGGPLAGNAAAARTGAELTHNREPLMSTIGGVLIWGMRALCVYFRCGPTAAKPPDATPTT